MTRQRGQTLCNCAVFETSFPDDAVWNEDDELAVPGGAAVSKALLEILELAGMTSCELAQRSYYGWLIIVKSQGVRVECLLLDLEPWILVTQAKGGFFAGKRRYGLHRNVIEALQDGMRIDSRFLTVEWTTRDRLVEEGRLKG